MSTKLLVSKILSFPSSFEMITFLFKATFSFKREHFNKITNSFGFKFLNLSDLQFYFIKHDYVNK